MSKTIEIIPAIDLIEGKCVRLSQGDYESKTVYNEDPLEQALQFEDVGLSRLHLVDLDGAKAGRLVNLKVLERIASKTKLVIDFGGGIKTNEAIRDVFNAGAKLATVGSIAVKEPLLFREWIRQYGSERLFLGADVKQEKIAVSGWLEQTDVSIYNFLKEYHADGISRVFCTDIEKDGQLAGPSIELYQRIMQEIPGIELVASGGVSGMADVERLNEIGCSGVIIGKAIYEGKISLLEIKKIMSC